MNKFHSPRMRSSALTALLVSSCGFMLPINAHAATWLAPNESVFSGAGSVVSIDASSSDDLLQYDHAANIESVKITGPNGAELPMDNAMRARSHAIFDVKLTSPGTTRIALTTAVVNGTYSVDGKAYRLATFRRPPPPGPVGAQAANTGAAPQTPPPPPPPPPPAAGVPPQAPPNGRPQMGVSDVSQIPSNATDIKLIQSTMRSETFATLGAPTNWTPTGVGLELVPGGTPPTDAVLDEIATFKFAFYGQPAVDTEVEVALGNQRFLAAPVVLKLKTDANGAVKIKWPAAGVYWINVKASGPGTIPNAVRQASYTAVVLVQKQ